MISRTALHAVRALVGLAELPEGQWAGAASLAREIGAPANYLGKLLQGLARQGLATSRKGLGGGFRLAKEAKEISLFDVVEPIDHASRWTGCFLGRPSCRDDAPCAVHARWAAVRDAYLRLLRETTVADLIEVPERLHALGAG